jgi:hypothetical protein
VQASPKKNCLGDDLDPKKHIIQSAVALSYVEARGRALLDIERKTAIARYIVVDHTIIGKGNSKYDRKIASLSALWIDDFVLRSCKEGNKYRVTAILPRKGIHYYPLPSGLNDRALAKIDEGRGVTLIHWISETRIKFTTNKRKCFGKIPNFFCIFPSTSKKTLVAIENRNGLKENVWLTPDDGKGYGSICAWRVTGPRYTNVTEDVELELSNRRVMDESGNRTFYGKGYEEVR